MEYINVTKCTFISKEHVIFDYVVRKREFATGEDPVKADGNIIINSKMMSDYDGRFCSNNMDNVNEIKRQIESAKEKCKIRAKWIFDGMNNDIGD